MQALLSTCNEKIERRRNANTTLIHRHCYARTFSRIVSAQYFFPSRPAMRVPRLGTKKEGNIILKKKHAP